MKNAPMNALKAFHFVYALNGVRNAARALGVSHSSVSRHIRELENWLGADLVDRNTEFRGIVFTDDGEAMGKAANRCFSELNQTISALREQRHSNSVVIDTAPSFAARWLLPRIAIFETENPNIQISVIVDQHPRPPGESGRDISIRMGNGPWPFEKAVPFMSETLFPVASPAYLKVQGWPSTPADLAGHRLLHDRDPNTAWSVWRARFGPDKLAVRNGSRFASSDLVLSAAEQGMGIALARERLARSSLDTGILVRPIVDCEIVIENAYWIVTGRAKPRKAVAILIEWLMKEGSASDHAPKFHSDSNPPDDTA